MQALLSFSRLEYSAILLALLLSIACLMRGLVYDGSVVAALCFCVPLMGFSFSSQHRVHPFFSKVTIATVSLFLLWVILQWGCLIRWMERPFNPR